MRPSRFFCPPKHWLRDSLAHAPLTRAGSHAHGNDKNGWSRTRATILCKEQLLSCATDSFSNSACDFDSLAEPRSTHCIT
jgi:hypothetical protein